MPASSSGWWRWARRCTCSDPARQRRPGNGLIPMRANIRTPDMGTRSDVHCLGIRSPCRAAGVRHSEFSFARLWADSSRLRAKVNCECLTPAVVLKALRDVRSGHPSPAPPGRRTPLAQRLIAWLLVPTSGVLVLARIAHVGPTAGARSLGARSCRAFPPEMVRPAPIRSRPYVCRIQLSNGAPRSTSATRDHTRSCQCSSWTSAARWRTRKPRSRYR